MIGTNRNLHSGLLGVLAICVVSAVSARAETRSIVAVSVSHTNINPTLGQSTQLNVRLAEPGSVTVQVIDRDGFPIRAVAIQAPAGAGENRWRWDGRDEAGNVVADEAYSFRVAWKRGDKSEIYFPADTPSHLSAVDAEYFASRTGTIVYTLPVASRVHLQAGVASKNPRTGKMEGPVMKTVVNREPRMAGRIAEPWNGFDESGLINVAELRDFVLAIATTPLPANSVVTYGNRQRTYAASALTRRGTSLFTPREKGSHHSGLTVLEDVSPAMRIEPLNAAWSTKDRAWIVRDRSLRMRVSLSGPSAATFAAQDGKLQRFVDGKLVANSKRPASFPTIIEMRLPKDDDVRSVSLNWESEYGAVAANTIRVRGGGQ